MVDTIAPMAPSAGAPPVTGIVTPLLQQAYLNDPRTRLAQLMAGPINSMASAPAYNTGGVIAKALATTVPAISQMMVGGEYQKRQADLGDLMQRALEAGQKGIPAGTDANGNPIQEVAPGFEAVSRVLSQSNDPVAQQLGMQFGVQGLATTQAARLQLLQKLGEKNLTLDSNNQVIPMPGAAQAAADVARPTEEMKANVDVSKAIRTAAGVAPIDVNKAIAEAQGKAPIDVFQGLFKPVVNRVTGEVTIPGMDQATVGKVMGAFGVTPQDLTPRSALRRDIQAAIATAGNSADTAPAGTPTPPVGAPGAAPTAPASSPLPATPTAGAGAPGTTAAGTAPPQGPVPAGTMKPIDEVPRVSLPTGEMPAGPSTLSQGRDPIAIKAAEGASEVATDQYKDVAASAKAAGQVRAQLGTMRATLNSGGINTNATAPARATISAYLNAVLGPKVAYDWTGIDPAKADVFNKDATRMGLTFARQTEGSREAVAAIKIALGANPSLQNTTEGNKKIIDLLDAGVQHDLDAQKYEDAWFKKNGHYVGAQEWFNQNHPPAEYTSKVIPYNLPRLQSGAVDPTQLQPNVTYMGKSGPGIWMGNGFRLVPTFGFAGSTR